MSYRIEDGEAVHDGLCRCAREQVDGASRMLSEEMERDSVNAVHAARKSLKKERSLLRLGRSTLGTEQRRAENGVFREVGRRLGGVRDADVVLQALDDLAERFSGQVPKSTFEALRECLDIRREAARRRLVESACTNDALDSLRSARLRIDDWHLRNNEWAAVSDGLLRSYRRGHRASKRARSRPTSENLHEWRKRAKDLWYHLRLLQRASPQALRGHAKEAHRLSDLLGDDHDLSVLREALIGMAGEVAVDVDPVFGLIDHRRGQLQASAFFLGDRVYAESPKAFLRRMHRYWRAWRRETQAADSRQPAELANAANPLATSS